MSTDDVTMSEMVEASSAFGGATAGDAVEAAMASLAESPLLTAAAAAQKKTRSTNLTHEQKRLICLYAKQNPTFTQAQLGKWAKEQFGLTAVPSQSSISHTLKRRHTFEHMKSEDWSSKRMRTVKHPELDTALANWFLYCQARQIRIQGDEIKAKALLFFDLMHLDTQTEPPQFSNGWLHSFQSRHGFSRSPNTHPADLDLIATREEFVEATKGYAPWDVFWMDESKLHFPLNPELLDAGVPYQPDSQFTIALCCNADGSDLMDPFFITDRSLLPDPEGEQPEHPSVEFGFSYAHNKKQWMTPTLFREWLLAFDWKMHEENRNVVLFVDSFSSHQVKKMVLKNVTVRFVAQTDFGESYLEAAEHAVFSGVKRRYRQHLLEALVERREAGKGDSVEVDILDAIQWVLKAWRELPKAVIAEAFIHLGVVMDDYTGGDQADGQAEEKIEAQIIALLKKLKLKLPIKLVDFVFPATERILDEQLTEQDFVDSAMDAGLTTSIPGRNLEPPRKMVRVHRTKKAFSAMPASAAAAANRPQQPRLRDDLAVAAVPEEEWQAWADSQRYRIDEIHALETVIRLCSDMKCEAGTLLDLNRMYAELLHKRHPERAAALGVAAIDVNAAGVDGKQSGGVCRFNFGAGSTTI